MMKILIISDTHRSLKNLDTALANEKPIDLLIHMGDVERQVPDIMKMVDCPMHIIAGNNDFLCGLDDEEEFEIGKYKVMITHGHQYYVGMSEQYLQEEARARGVDIVMYGHTHVPKLIFESDLITLNPGSLTYPRQKGRRPSYMVMTIDESGEASFRTEYL